MADVSGLGARLRGAVSGRPRPESHAVVDGAGAGDQATTTASDRGPAAAVSGSATVVHAAPLPPPPPPPPVPTSGATLAEPSPLDAVLERRADDDRYGAPGRPVSRQHPFYLGFVGAIGVLVAIALVQMLGRLSGVLTLLVVALFLALGLDPVVAALERRGVRRSAGVALVFAGLLAVVAGFVSAVAPVLVREATQLAASVPTYAQQVQESTWFQRLDEEYGVVSRFSEEAQSRLTNSDFVATVFGGVLGAGRAVLDGFFSTFTVLVLTLYFLASMRAMKEAAYRLVPLSRRRRVQLLGDEIARRIGGYTLGQLGIAALNGLLSWFVLSLLGQPYAAVLAMVVGVFGLIPLVGATIGAVIACVIVAFTSVTDALILAAYYLVYQQVENYLIAPRIFARTVSVPGAVAVVAALAGGSLLGIIGALIAIPIAAGVLLVVQEVLLPRQERA